MDYADLDELKEAVEANGNVLTLPVLEVRDAHGAHRLGAIVRANISKALEGRGIGHFPPELPDRQNEPVRLYKRGTPTADLIEAVLSPSEGGDKTLRDAAAGEASDVLEQVKELVCG